MIKFVDSDILRCSDALYKEENGYCVFCFDEDHTRFNGIVEVFMRGLLSCFDAKITEVEEIEESEGRLAQHVRTDLPYSLYKKIEEEYLINS